MDVVVAHMPKQFSMQGQAGYEQMGRQVASRQPVQSHL